MYLYFLFFSHKFIGWGRSTALYFDINKVYLIHFLDVEVCDCSYDLLLFWTPFKDIQIFPEGDNFEGEIFKYYGFFENFNWCFGQHDILDELASKCSQGIRDQNINNRIVMFPSWGIRIGINSTSIILVNKCNKYLLLFR